MGTDCNEKRGNISREALSLWNSAKNLSRVGKEISVHLFGHVGNLEY
jgi:hypothetical protein